MIGPTLRLIGRKASSSAVSAAPNAGAARNGPEPFDPDMQDVAGIDRQHRGRPAEHHGEQIKADGAQHDAIVADIAKPFDQAAPWRHAGRFGPRHRADAEQRDQCAAEHQRGGDIGARRVGGIEIGAQRWPEDGARLPADRIQRDRGGQDVARHQIGGQRRQRRPGKGPADAEQGGDDEQAPGW